MALFAERCPKTAVSRSQSSNQTLAASALFRIVRQTNEGRHSAFGIKLDNVRVVGFKVTTLETKDTLYRVSHGSEEKLARDGYTIGHLRSRIVRRLSTSNLCPCHRCQSYAAVLAVKLSRRMFLRVLPWQPTEDGGLLTLCQRGVWNIKYVIHHSLGYSWSEYM